MTDDVLTLQSLSAGYRTPILHDITLRVSPGELLCLLGPNGCGKTTLLRAIIGSARLFSGSVCLSGTDASALSLRERARRMAFVSQQNPPCAGLLGMDVLAMGLFASRSPLSPLTPAQKESIRKTAAALGTEAYLHRDCGTLSAGQRQLLHLTRAAVQNTPLLLLDEPNSALDFENTHRYLTHLRVFLHREGRGALLILHDPALALRYGDRILPMQAGRITGDIRPDDAKPDAMEAALRPLYPSLRLTRLGERWYTDTTERNEHAAN